VIAVEEWLHGFVLPLVAGGDVRVRGALGAAELGALLEAQSLGGESQARIAEARHQVAVELVYDAPRPALDETALRLAVAMQDLLFLQHPGARGPFVTRGRRRQLARFAVEMATLPPPAGVIDLVERHSMVHHLFSLGRDDVRVSFWAGRREYKGAEPPGRLLKWSRLRRVREERWRVGVVAESVADPLQREIVAALCAASPLTDLCEPTRLEPRFDLLPLARWLREPRVARAVADRWLSLGLEQVGPQLVPALLDLYNRKETAQAARTATSFLCHLHLLSLLAQTRDSAATRQIRLETMVQRQEAMRDFLGLFAAAERLGLSRPPDLARDARLDALVDSHARMCLALCGEPRTRELHNLMLRGLQPGPGPGLALAPGPG
jgi:hypothetical protein